MTTNYDKIGKPISLLALGLLFICAILIDLDSPENSIPALLMRGKKIQMGNEWSNVQMAYTANLERLEQNHQDHEAKLNLAKVFIQEARVTGEHGHYYPAALEMVESVLSSTKNQEIIFQALTLKSGVLLSLHEFEAARKIAEQALAINSYNAQIHGVLVDAYIEMGAYEKAIQCADKMINIRPDLRSYARVSYLREIYGHPDQAIDALKLAAESGYPGHEETAWTWQTLGELYLTYGDLEKASNCFKNILNERPNYPFAIAGLAEIDLTQKKYQAAEHKLNQAIDIIPEVGYYISLAKIYKELNRDQELNNILKEILLMLEDDVDAGHVMNLEYAELYLSLFNDPDKAIEFLKIEYDQRPANIDVNRMLAKSYLVLNDLNSAKKHLRQAEITNSKHPELIQLQASLL